MTNVLPAVFVFIFALSPLLLTDLLTALRNRRGLARATGHKCAHLVITLQVKTTSSVLDPEGRFEPQTMEQKCCIDFVLMADSECLSQSSLSPTESDFLRGTFQSVHDCLLAIQKGDQPPPWQQSILTQFFEERYATGHYRFILLATITSS